MKKALVLGVLALGITSAARADLPPPPDLRPEPPGQHFQLSLVPAQDGKAVLELPRALQKSGGTKKSEFPDQTRTVFAGLFLSLGLIGGGLWAARRRGAGGAGIVAGVAAALAVGAAGGAAWANMAPPRTGPAPKAEVVWTDTGEIRLHLTQQQLEALSTRYGRELFRSSPAAGLKSSPPPSSGSQPPAW